MIAIKYFDVTQLNVDGYVLKRYRQLVLQYHPDRPTGDNKIMQEINSEYDALKKITEPFWDCTMHGKQRPMIEGNVVWACTLCRLQSLHLENQNRYTA